MFQHIPPFAGDPILSLNEEFQKDPRANKINLSIGIYFDDTGRIPVMRAVREAEARGVAQGVPKSYLPIEGAPNFRAAVQGLLWGEGHEAVVSGRVATLQTVGSSGGLKVGADFIARYFPGSAVWVSDPTWDNHRAMFEGAGLQVNTYPYFDAASGGLNFEAMLTALNNLPRHSVVLLHAGCHNPTGVDLTRAQWNALIPVLQTRELLPYLDLAYQGFGHGVQADAWSLRALASAGVSFFIANSFSKSMSIYGERAGALSVVCASAVEAQNVLGQLKATVRRNYSSPPIHAGQLVATVLTDPALRQDWEAELASMRERIVHMRHALHAALQALAPHKNFDFLLTQSGMFSYTGFTVAQVEQLRADHGLYMLRSGRICMAGLNTGNVQAAGQAMAKVL
jgi:aromatic-amino-acid transaminase